METSKQTNCSASVSKSYQHSPSSSYEKAMTIDATGLSPGCSDCQSMINSVKQQRNKNLSITDLFSKYKSSQHAQSSAYEETIQGTYAFATLTGDVSYSEEVWKILLMTVRTSKDDVETDSSSGFEIDSYEDLLAPLSKTKTALLEIKTALMEH
ncbi:hypothetical protein CK203_092464 [Vitis vinifera]|uniref:Uncharacterized protein n=1 Tax=Vitis vinifera TaxID=29760 RepID=A0A438EBW8_VITVI|nr:hypothetical protein CK203_092464 [Vitis vinifera]